MTVMELFGFTEPGVKSLTSEKNMLRVYWSESVIMMSQGLALQFVNTFR